MKPNSQAIRKELAAIGITSRQVSVKCTPSYKIFVETKDATVDRAQVRKIAETCYYAKPHSWLCVFVDGAMLGLSL